MGISETALASVRELGSGEFAYGPADDRVYAHPRYTSTIVLMSAFFFFNAAAFNALAVLLFDLFPAEVVGVAAGVSIWFIRRIWWCDRSTNSWLFLRSHPFVLLGVFGDWPWRDSLLIHAHSGVVP